MRKFGLLGWVILCGANNSQVRAKKLSKLLILAEDPKTKEKISEALKKISDY